MYKIIIKGMLDITVLGALAFLFSILPIEYVFLAAYPFVWGMFGMYRNFLATFDVTQVIRLAWVSLAILAVHSFFYTGGSFVHIVMLHTSVFVGLLGLRLIFVVYRSPSLLLGHARWRNSGEMTLIIGAGEASTIFLSNRISANFDVLGIFDDDVTMKGRYLQGIKIIGPIKQIEAFLSLYTVKNIIYLIPSIHIDQHRLTFNAIQKKYPTIKWLEPPPFNDISRGLNSLFELTSVNFLPTNAAPSTFTYSLEQKKKVIGRVAFITGGAGSVGSNIVEELLAHDLFAALVVIDTNEMNCYHLSESYQHAIKQKKLIIHMSDYGDVKQIHSLISQYQPIFIYHAEAYKHVNLLESGNVYNAVHNNVVKSVILAKAIQEHACVKQLVLVSSDKAVNPTNVMGQTKRLVEIVLSNICRNSAIDLITVRFGNVIGSSGSVFHKFLMQIQGRQKITLTDREVTRYFMNISQAANLIIKASLTGFPGKVYVLNMGEPIKIYDFLMSMIDRYGDPEQKEMVVITGLRPGEKRYEELYYQHENIQTLDKDLFIGDLITKDLDVQVLMDQCTLLHSAQDELPLKKWLSQSIRESGEVK